MDDKTLSDSDIPEDPALGSDQDSSALEAQPLPEAEEGKPTSSAEVNDASSEGEESEPTPSVEVDEASQEGEEGEASRSTEATEASPEGEEDTDAAPEGTGREWKPVAIPRWARFPMSAQAGWIATLVTTLLAALIRLPGLGTIKTLVFDETYYVKDAYSLMTLGYEGSWAKDNDPMFISGDYSGLSTNGGYVVHPSVGKWLISLGMRVFGATNPVGWRISAAIAGIILVFLTARIAQHLFRSPAITALAGFFMATDGIAIVLSRTGLLDVFLAMFAAAAFLAVLKDQEISHPRLVEKLSQWKPDPDNPSRIGPHAGARWWLLVAGILCGLAMSVKWSGLYALAVLGLFVAFRDWMTRRRFGHPRAFYATLINDTSVAFLAMVPPAVITYVASWFGWFRHWNAYGHKTHGFIGAFHDLWDYHVGMLKFHTGLTTPHTYQAHPAQWFVQARPTSFAWNKIADASCDKSDCVNAVVALGNPLLWWFAAIAFFIVLFVTLRDRNWRTGFVVCGYLAMYFPWYLNANRTIFNFYTIAFVPFVCLSAAWVIGLMLDQTRCEVDPDRMYASQPLEEGDYRWMGANVVVRQRFAIGAVVIVLLITAVSIFFMPLWRGDLISYNFWHIHMWLPTWI